MPRMLDVDHSSPPAPGDAPSTVEGDTKLTAISAPAPLHLDVSRVRDLFEKTDRERAAAERERDEARRRLALEAREHEVSSRCRVEEFARANAAERSLEEARGALRGIRRCGNQHDGYTYEVDRASLDALTAALAATDATGEGGGDR